MFKRSLLLLFFILFSTFSVSIAGELKDIRVSVNNGTQLDIIVFHPTEEMKEDHVDNIQVFLGDEGEPSIAQKFSLQQNAKLQKASYNVPELKKNKALKIRVTARCSENQELSKEFIIE